MQYFTVKVEAIQKFPKQYVLGAARLVTFSITQTMQQEWICMAAHIF